MKKIILAFALIFTIFVVKAGEEISWQDVCKEVGGAARNTMESRQLGVSISHLMEMELVKKEPILESMIIGAYETPRYSTKEHQDKAVADFQNDAYLKCAKALRK